MMYDTTADVNVWLELTHNILDGGRLITTNKVGEEANHDDSTVSYLS